MADVTTWNKATVPGGTNPWDLRADLQQAVESANIPVPVASQAERDALNPPGGKYPGMAVFRTDHNGALQVWDGATWDNSINPVANSGWTLTGHIVKRATASGVQATAGFGASYSGGAITNLNNSFQKIFTITNIGTFKPYLAVYNPTTIYTSINSGAAVAGIEYSVNTAGEVWARLSSLSSASVPSGAYFYVNTVWPI